MSGGSGGGHPSPPGYRIRLRRPEDDAHLVVVENAAGHLLASHGYPALAEDGLSDIAALRRMIDGGTVFVAVDPEDAPVGFAVAQPLSSYAHLRELSVHPDHGRRGLGRALVSAVIDTARQQDRAGVSLTTFRSVPFNRPFYETLGFRELALDEAGDDLASAFRSEVPVGIDPAERVLMIVEFNR